MKDGADNQEYLFTIKRKLMPDVEEEYNSYKIQGRAKTTTNWRKFK